MAVFISVPMAGRTKEDIRLDIQAATNVIEKKYESEGKLIPFCLDGLVPFIPHMELATDLTLLGNAIAVLGQATEICLLPGWHESRGCQIERMCALKYGIDIIQISDYDFYEERKRIQEMEGQHGE